MRPFAFLDRDGTLIEDRGYAHRLDDYAPLPGAHAAVEALRGAGYGIAIVTNQSGIARGLFDAAALERFNAHLRADFAERGADIDGIYVCPHAPDDGCACRKPAPGLIEQACREHQVDLARSVVIGDRASDVELGLRAGCRAALVLTGEGERARDGLDASVLVARDLLAAVTRLL